MNNKIKKRLVALSHKLYHVPEGKNKHFSFILDKSKIIAFGTNDGFKTHPKAKELQYRFCAIHSELSAILRYRGKDKDFSHFTLVNIRINHDKNLGMSKPCEICQQLIESLGFAKVFYTDYNGQFIRYK